MWSAATPPSLLLVLLSSHAPDQQGLMGGVPSLVLWIPDCDKEASEFMAWRCLAVGMAGLAFWLTDWCILPGVFLVHKVCSVDANCALLYNW